MSSKLPQFSPCLYSWDLSIWRFLHQVSGQSPEQASSVFDIPLHIIIAISELSPREIEQLASGVLCSFIPLFSHSELEEIVFHSRGELLIGGDSSVNLLERIYWELVARSSMVDLSAASVRFGLAKETIELFSKASPILIHEICSTLETDFRLRFNPEIILEMQYASPVTALMKRAAAAFG